MYNKQRYILVNTLIKAGVFSLLKKHKAILAGGAVRAVFAGEHISDYDIYFSFKEDADKFLNSVEDEGFHQVSTTPSAITYKKEEFKLQVIRMPEFYRVSMGIISQFDFTVCMGAFEFSTEEFVLESTFLEHLARRELHYNVEANYPLASMFRVRKYLKKGYTISGTEIIKLGLAVHSLNIDNYTDLKKQLEGIDTLFLKDLTDKLTSPEYAGKKYDFLSFLDMLDDYFKDKLDNLFEE